MPGRYKAFRSITKSDASGCSREMQSTTFSFSALVARGGRGSGSQEHRNEENEPPLLHMFTTGWHYSLVGPDVFGENKPLTDVKAGLPLPRLH